MRQFWLNLTHHNGIYCIIATKNHMKMLYHSSTISVKSGLLRCNEIYPLPLTYLKTLLEYIYEL